MVAMNSYKLPGMRRNAVLFVCLLLFASPLFAGEYSSGVSSRILKKTTLTGNGQKIAYPVTDRAEVTAMTVDIAPGAETGWHKHPVPVYAYVISGKLSVELEDGSQLSFEANEAIIEVVNTLHNGKNKGAEPVKLAVFYLGAEGTPNVIKPELPLKASGAVNNIPKTTPNTSGFQ
jgi:quercetin dioxygenase-like cupin family protein